MVRSHTPEVLLLLVKMYPHLPISAIYFSVKGMLKRNIGVGNIQKHFGQQGPGFLAYRVLILSQAQTIFPTACVEDGSDMTGRFAD